MKRATSADFVRNFSIMCDEARVQPIVMTRNGRARLVVTSVEEYKHIVALALLAAGTGEEAQKLSEILARVA